MILLFLDQIFRCCSCPSTYMALNGRDGHRFSQAPQPMHFSSFTTRKLRRIRVVRVFCHHQDRLGRAMAGTVAASDAVPVDDAIFLNQYGMSDLDSRLVRFRDRTDRSGRANFRTFDAFGTTVSSLVRYFWLHKCLKVPRRTQHMVRTNRYTKLARGAMLGEIGSAQRARRSDRGCPVRFLFIFDDGQSAVDFLVRELYFFLGFQCG